MGESEGTTRDSCKCVEVCYPSQFHFYFFRHVKFRFLVRYVSSADVTNYIYFQRKNFLLKISEAHQMMKRKTWSTGLSVKQIGVSELDDWWWSESWTGFFRKYFSQRGKNTL